MNLLLLADMAASADDRVAVQSGDERFTAAELLRLAWGGAAQVGDATAIAYVGTNGPAVPIALFAAAAAGVPYSPLNYRLGIDDLDATAAPARQVDMSALPAAWIGVGTVDLFYDEDLVYAERLRAAGVACDLVEVPGAFHGFDSVAPATTVARRFSDAQVDALARAFALDEPR